MGGWEGSGGRGENVMTISEIFHNLGGKIFQLLIQQPKVSVKSVKII